MKISIVRTLVSLIVSLLAQAGISLLDAHAGAWTPTLVEAAAPVGAPSAGDARQARPSPGSFN